MSAEDRDDRDPLQSLIAAILNAESLGEAVDRDALIEKHPDQAESLRDFFANHDRVKSAAEVDPPTSDESQLDDPTIPPSAEAREDATLPPTEPALRSGDDALAIGDKVRYFGNYELLEEIARGGMGVVYKARQMNLNRIVALKMILAGMLAGEEEVKRFKLEAEAAAQLDHPAIVPVFEIGEHDGQHYFSMGYVKGESLAERLRDGPLSAKETAELMAKICEAVSYAHDKGVIHRDLKPGNVLIDASGTPKVSDFGLAKRVGSDSDLTRTGQVLGTPAYMPPEQAAGRLDEIGPPSDVYALGAILYVMLTGTPPFQAATPVETLRQVIDDDVVPPRRINPAATKDLETICLKCLNKSPGKRYENAGALANELRRFLNYEPIHARPAGELELIWRWMRRNPVVTTMTTILLIVSLGYVVTMTALYEFARTHEQAANEQANRAERHGAITVEDPSLVHSRAKKSGIFFAPFDLEGGGGFDLTWRIYLPSERRYRACIAYKEIPWSHGPGLGGQTNELLRYPSEVAYQFELPDAMVGTETEVSFGIQQEGEKWRFSFYGAKSGGGSNPLRESDGVLEWAAPVTKQSLAKTNIRGASRTFRASRPGDRVMLYRWVRDSAAAVDIDIRDQELEEIDALAAGIMVWIEPVDVDSDSWKPTDPEYHRFDFVGVDWLHPPEDTPDQSSAAQKRQQNEAEETAIRRLKEFLNERNSGTPD